ncbi:MAG: NAD(P)-dependent oxidoreductase [Chloroflexi bacterium]|nr:NAD(P)-dependent oxidoreductase [Chloroflexota bacterium]
MNILVTGGAGYIGSILTPALLAEGHQVTVLDSFMYNQGSLLDCCANPGFTIIRGDCRDEGTVREALRGKDVIIALAALVGAPLCDRDQVGATTTNLEAIRLLLKLRSREQRILYPNTNSGYGVGQPGVPCTEESPLRPISLYGRTKVEAEQTLLEDGRAISFRLATVFGLSPRMRLDLLVNDFVYRAVHDRSVVIFEGHFVRNYIHVRDVARAFIHGLSHFDQMQGQAYNVGLEEANLSKVQLCQRIQQHLPKFTYLEAPIGEDPDKRDYVVSNEKIRRAGFEPCHSLDDGIRELIKGFTIIRNSVYGNV